MSEHILNLTDTALDTVLSESSIPILLDLWAPWCGPCRALAPILESLAEQTQGSLQIAKLDVQQYPEIMQRFGIRGIPVLLLFRDGAEISRSIGLKSLAELGTWLQSQNIEVRHPEQTVLQSQVQWSSFYGDASLHDFLFQRLQQLAEQGKVAATYHHEWSGDTENGTVSAALVRHSNLHVFERQTALPATIALLLNRASLTSTDDIDALAQALPTGRDVSHIPLGMMESWLKGDDQLQWEAWLKDSPVNHLRQRWLSLVSPYLQGQTIALKDWQMLHTQASLHESWQPLEQAIAALVANLSPPPSIQDTSAWTLIMELIETSLTEGMMIAAGFTVTERSAIAQRAEAFIKAIGDTSIFALPQDLIESFRSNWEQEHAELVIKEHDFYAHYEERTADIHRNYQIKMLQAFLHSPVFVPANTAS